MARASSVASSPGGAASFSLSSSPSPSPPVTSPVPRKRVKSEKLHAFVRIRPSNDKKKSHSTLKATPAHSPLSVKVWSEGHIFQSCTCVREYVCTCVCRYVWCGWRSRFLQQTLYANAIVYALLVTGIYLYIK